MRTLLFYILSLFCISGLQAQMHNGNFGNEWINYNQSYYKMKITEDGLYRINAAVLQNAGINVANLIPNNLQIFCMGQEVPIYVYAPSGTVNYIEFYGKKHRGEMDVNLYYNAAHHFNPEYSAITDTAAYFLTWNNAGISRQFTDRTTNISGFNNPESYYMHRSVTPVTTGWRRGKDYQISTELLTKSSFDFGEGWGSPRSANQTVNVSTTNIYSSGPAATGHVRCYSAGAVQHNLDIRISGNSLYSTTMSTDNVGTHSFSIPLNLLSSTTGIQVVGMAGASDQNSVSYADIVYPRTFDFGGVASYPFKIAASTSVKYLQISNFNATGASAQTIYLYDLTNNERLQCFWDGSVVRADLQPSATERELVLVNLGASAGYKTIGRLDAVTFTNYSPLDGNYIIVYHASLATNSQGGNPIIDYAAYRASTGFNPVIVDVQQVFDQFGYGLNMHPVSMRNFATYLKQNWTDPQYLFIIGKGRVYYTVRNFNTYDNLIPTFGYPPSDNCLLSPLGSDVPAIPVGRLAATTGDQVSLYLQKIRDVEAHRTAAQTPIDRSWMKKIIHLGGGADASQQNIIRNNLNAMKSIAEGVQFGGDVTSFFKTSTNPIQAAQSVYLDSLIDNGVSMITFFGHSSANSFDFNLDRPENYDNYQKYPLIMSLGCYGGTIFEDGMRISEEFIFEPDAGAGVFLASVGASALSALNIFAAEYYRFHTGADYGKGAAKMVQSAINYLESNGIYSTTIQMVCQYMTYHGDPAFNFNTTKRPDYYIDNSLVSHTPSVVTTQMNDFDLVLNIYNLGKAIDTVFWVEINRELPSGEYVFVSKQRVSAPNYHTQFNITIPVGGLPALGLNYFDIKIDSDEEVAEEPNPAAEQNNTALRYPIFILSDAILPVYPPEFAIVPTQPITLKASTGNTLAAMMTYKMEIDTSEYFNSPILQQTSIAQAGGMIEWTPSLTYIDSTVYYWRVGLDTFWTNSSFIYIDDEYPGWNQSHYFQYKKDVLKNIELEEPARKFDFISSLQEILLYNGFTPSPTDPEYLAVYLNGNKIERCRCPFDRGVYVQVIDSSNLDIWELPGNTSRYGAINCDPGGRDAMVFLFETDLVPSRTHLENFLRDSIPDGFFVLVYTLNNAFVSDWDNSNPNLIPYLQSQGSTLITALEAAQGGLPWGFFYQKNTPSFIYKNEALAAAQGDAIQLSCLMDGNWDSGDVQWTRVGPAQNWYSFHWRTSRLDAFPTDVVSVDIYGVESNGNRILVMPNVNTPDTNITAINATLYPYLDLVWNNKDDQHKTAAQLDYWRILADPAPEAALRPEIYYSLQSDTLQQGAPLSFEIMMQNISAVDMDSMLVKYQVLGSPNLTYYKRLGPLPAGDTMRSTILEIPTLNLNGPQQLLVEINPDNDQREMYHFNNIALTSFYVNGDIVNPLLDVTFDGVRIMNGDIVSGKPQIVISLTDENQWLGLDELEDFKIILRHPSIQNGETELTATNPLHRNPPLFLPADASNLVVENKAQIILDLDLQWDGTYTLFVSATDKSGNNSGELDYSIDFEVINTPMISNVLNYPNPFTTQTQFVFTLTGREVPEYMKIQIMTVTGKIVREIGKDELGPIHIGINRTEFAWDGTDQFGDRLANGVYLYRVISKLNKSDKDDMKLYNTPASYMFRNGFGKMYLMR